LVIKSKIDSWRGGNMEKFEENKDYFVCEECGYKFSFNDESDYFHVCQDCAEDYVSPC
jgi:transcription initiation factor IIE alpha subunit